MTYLHYLKLSIRILNISTEIQKHAINQFMRQSWRRVQQYFTINLPRLFLVPFFLAIMSSCSIFFSRKSCFLVSISSVSRSLWRASWVVGAPRDRWCLDLEELDEELELPLNSFDILLMVRRVIYVSEVTVRFKIFQTPRICVVASASRCFHVQVRWRRIFRIGGSVDSTPNGGWMRFFHHTFNNYRRDVVTRDSLRPRIPVFLSLLKVNNKVWSRGKNEALP